MKINNKVSKAIALTLAAIMLVLLLIHSIAVPSGVVHAENEVPAAADSVDGAKTHIGGAASSTETAETGQSADSQTGAAKDADKASAQSQDSAGDQSKSENPVKGESAKADVGKESAGSTQAGTSGSKPDGDRAKTAAAKTPAKAPAKAPAKPVEFDESKPFTTAMLDQAADVDEYGIDLENADIPVENFKIESETEDGKPGSCQLKFPTDLETIKAGELRNTAPALLSDEEHENGHGYSYAHVGSTRVYYVGWLKVFDGEQKKQYIVYTTDKQIDKRTVYVVLKEIKEDTEGKADDDDQKIHLVYRHGAYHAIDYQFQDMNGQIIQEGKAEGDPWTYDKIFGHDRLRSVASGKGFNGTVTIPRGYKATVLVQDKDSKPLHDPIELGKMMKYSWQQDTKNTIKPDDDNKNAQKFKASYPIENVSKDVTVIVKYEKIESFTFNAKFWRQTDYANGRFKVRTGEAVNSTEQSANDTNCMVKFDGDKNSFTWNFNGITSSSTTWEMDQLEINGEPIAVPMVSIAESDTTITTTTLSTGTVITLSVTSLGGKNGSNAKRAYTLTAKNCYEDLTISGGNMVGHTHKEFVVRELTGIERGVTDLDTGELVGGSAYWHGTDDDGKWWPLKQNTLIAHTNRTPRDGFNTFRMKPARGYKKLNVTVTDKEGNVLQANDTLSAGITAKCIKYLTRKDDGSGAKTSKGTYEEVAYDKWVPDADGYYYCKATPELHDRMQLSDRNGVVLFWFSADADMYGIDYQNGADENAKVAPAAESIDNLPLYQDGGEKGYNLIDNTQALISNHVPMDKNGNFVFDHWEVLIADEDGPTDKVKMRENGTPDDPSDDTQYTLEAGNAMPLSTEALKELEDCLYYNTEQERNTLTLRAVWRSTAGIAPIPYTVNYYITNIQDNGTQTDEILLEGHQHMANQGATLVADLWQDSNKTLSPIIQEILEGENDQKEDYTKGGKVKYVIYEPMTDKKLEDLQTDNDVVNIFLVKQPNLTIGKTVDGKHGDLTKKFTFTIEAEEPVKPDKPEEKKKPLNGTYAYTGGTIDNVSGAIAPEDGELTFTGGEATIELAHGQQITLTDLPFGSWYTVTEDEDGYNVAYSKNGENVDSAEGPLHIDQTVLVKNTKTDIAETGIADDANRFEMMLVLGTTALLLLALAGLWRTRKRARR